MERVQPFNPKRLRRSALMFGALTLSAGLAACSGGDQTATPSTSREATASTQPVAPSETTSPTKLELIPDMSSFLKAGTTDTCFNGGARPCGLLLRETPNLDSARVNVGPQDKLVTWPLETYGDQGGDSLTIDCVETAGDKVTSYDGKLVTSDWYAVEVPIDKVHDPSVQSSNEGQSSIVAYASVAWFNQSQPPAGVPTC